MVPIIFFGRRVRKLARASQDRVGDVGAYVDEALHEIRTVQAYGHEAEDRRQFGARVEERVRHRAAARFASARFWWRRSSCWCSARSASFCGSAATTWSPGRISAGQLSAFVFYAVIVASAVGTISEVVGDLQRAAGATERLFELLAIEPAIRAPEHPVPLPVPARGTVRFRDVTFHYPSRPDTAALEDFSLDVAAGEKVALVGPSGAGKTTVFQLLLRFYDPQRGSVAIDGIDLRAADPAPVRARLALVPQDPVIFAASVLENVRYGRPDATRRGGARPPARRPTRPNSSNGCRTGSQATWASAACGLSGGQRQRLAIARAILADRPILLLDEATSALDAESERMVQLALERLMAGRTVLIIAHRLATVRHADRIAVMERGRIIATGTHDELTRSNPLYARLAALQFGAGFARSADAGRGSRRAARQRYNNRLPSVFRRP